MLVDVNVGLPRCGIAPGEPAVALAKRVDATAGVVLRGAMGYEGHVVGIETAPSAKRRRAKAMDRLLSTARMMRDAGLRCEIVSAGGTGTFDITGGMEGITEVQAGIVRPDGHRATRSSTSRSSWRSRSTARCSAARARSSALTDAGLKACAVDHGNPASKDVDGANVLFLSDEHATITLPADSPIAVGDRIDLLAVAHRPDDQPARRAVRRRRRRGRRGVADHGAVVPGASGLA